MHFDPTEYRDLVCGSGGKARVERDVGVVPDDEEALQADGAKHEELEQPARGGCRWRDFVRLSRDQRGPDTAQGCLDRCSPRGVTERTLAQPQTDHRRGTNLASRLSEVAGPNVREATEPALGGPSPKHQECLCGLLCVRDRW